MLCRQVVTDVRRDDLFVLDACGLDSFLPLRVEWDPMFHADTTELLLTIRFQTLTFQFIGHTLPMSNLRGCLEVKQCRLESTTHGSHYKAFLPQRPLSFVGWKRMLLENGMNPFDKPSLEHFTPRGSVLRVRQLLHSVSVERGEGLQYR
ncbi:hypothetical protein AVEN_177773-1 [Araneus ventricosus]|uniref:Uncharacterized protein n=1 Tax=Araneus ventricosus TaxID=182803 RepID=A0A4Y2RUW7_ARAVE|nr:hypothetical protein AVEN_177773-1 [Araneus ventricosus]